MEKKEKKKLTPRLFVSRLTGFLFAVYAAYNIFLIVRDADRGMPSEGILISAVVALMFAALAVFMWTPGFKQKDLRFLMVRRAVFIVAMLVLFTLKLRLIGRYVTFIDFSEMYTVLYCVPYFATLAAFFLLLIFFIFIIKRRPFYPRARVVLPAITIILFVIALIAEALLYFLYNTGMEANALRTLVIRPVFYLGFIGLSAYFLFDPKTN